MKIKEILVESFKSPLFNLLAIANLIMIAFSVTVSFPLIVFTPFTKLVISLNLPALASSRVLAEQYSDMFIFIPPLVYLQWIMIGTLAKLIASRWKPKAV